MRKLLQIFFWIVKGLLLVIALAALVMWPISCGRSIGGSAEKCTLQPKWVETHRFKFGCHDGRAFVVCYFSQSTYLSLRDEAERAGPRWHWDALPYDSQWPGKLWRAGWGPVRWRWQTYGGPYLEMASSHNVAVSLWLVALAFGVWPAVSLSLVVRRRLLWRRVRGRGLCERCGYDLRATPRAPSEGGEVLAVCPECGHASGAKR